MELQVDNFIESLRDQGGCSQRTIEAYKGDLKRFCDYLESVLKHSAQVDDFNQETLSDFLQSERKAGKRASTLLRRRAALRRFGEYLAERDLIDDSLTKESLIKKPNLSFRGNGNYSPKVLSEGEINRIFALLEKNESARSLRDLAISKILLETGISIGTLVAIDLEDIDPKNQRISVRPEGFSKGYWIGISASFEPISAYLREGRPNLTDSSIERAMFVSQMGGRLSRQAVWQALQNWGRKANLNNGLTPSVIRHTAVKRMYNEEKSVEEIQRMLGHRNALSTRALLRRLQAASSQ